MGGLATAGGVGFLGREHGLTIDHIVAADVLLADGTVAHASASENAELFWAVRGAGANVGIVVSFDFVADRVGDVGWAQLAFQVDDAAKFLEDFGRLQESSPRDTTLFLILSGGRPAEPATAQMYGVVNSSDPDTIIARLEPFASLAPLVGQQVQLLPYAQVMANASDVAHNGQGEPSFRSGLVEHLDAPTAARRGRPGDVGFGAVVPDPPGGRRDQRRGTGCDGLRPQVGQLLDHLGRAVCAVRAALWTRSRSTSTAST